jgi:hypothetical protein
VCRSYFAERLLAIYHQNYNNGKETSANGSTNVAFPSLFGREGDELMLPKEIAKQVGEDIVDNDQQGGYDKVDEAFVNVEADHPGSR